MWNSCSCFINMIELTTGFQIVDDLCLRFSYADFQFTGGYSYSSRFTG